MAVFLVGQMTVRDESLWQQYVEGVQKSLQPFSAELIFRGKKSQQLTGTLDYESAVVIKFMNQDELNQWYQSETYQCLIPIRDRAADLVITTYEA